MSEMMPTFGGRTLEEINNEPSESPYIKNHPNAIADKDKAEVMAYASKEHEEGVVEAANRAVRFAKSAAGIAIEGAATSADLERVPGSGDHNSAIASSLKQAQQAREMADSSAERAAEDYDRVQGVVEQASALKSGKTQS